MKYALKKRIQYFCKYHRDTKHTIKNFYELKWDIKKLIRKGNFKIVIKKTPNNAQATNEVTNLDFEGDEQKDKVKAIYLPSLEALPVGWTIYFAYKRYARTTNVIQHIPKQLNSPCWKYW